METRTITVNSISKTYFVTGWRVGWAIAHKPITERIRKVHDFLTVGAPTPFQHAAVTALSFSEEYYANLRAHYTKVRRFLITVLQETGFKPHIPKGAYYTIADVSDLMKKLEVADDVSCSQKLIELTGVATVPGSAFYSKPEMGKNQVRFCFCKKWETLHAIDQLLRKLIE